MSKEEILKVFQSIFKGDKEDFEAWIDYYSNEDDEDETNEAEADEYDVIHMAEEYLSSRLSIELF